MRWWTRLLELYCSQVGHERAFLLLVLFSPRDLRNWNEICKIVYSWARKMFCMWYEYTLAHLVWSICVKQGCSKEKRPASIVASRRVFFFSLRGDSVNNSATESKLHTCNKFRDLYLWKMSSAWNSTYPFREMIASNVHLVCNAACVQLLIRPLE